MLRYLVRLYRYDFFDFDTDTENCMLLPIFRFKSTDTSKLAHRRQNQWGKGARAPQKFVHRAQACPDHVTKIYVALVRVL